MIEIQRRIDAGRVVAVTLFTSFFLLNCMRLLQGDPLQSPLSSMLLILTMAFYVLLIWAYLRRAPSTRTDLRWTSWLVAFLGTAGPFAIPLVSDGQRDGGILASLAAAVLALGLVAMLWALGALGSNISVVPQAREVVTHGPYSRVRHPLYAAELVNGVGLCMATTGPWPWLVLTALLCFQVLRARREEALLSRELPGYDEYRRRTPMLVPAVGRT